MASNHFTLDEANELVPWLEETFAAMLPVRDELLQRQEEVVTLLGRRRSNGHSSTDEEIAEAQMDVDRITQRLQNGLREITQKGILVRDVGRGLVDFPSHRAGREVFLCWYRGEARIDYWHETNTGIAGRQRL